MGSDDDMTNREIRDALHRIEVQTKLTNGTVKSLLLWRAFITGGLTILSILVVPLFIWFITHKAV